MFAGVVHVPSFFHEVATLKEKGLAYENRLFLSDRGEGCPFSIGSEA